LEVTGIANLVALAEGRFKDAAALADEALAFGESAIPEVATPHHQMYQFGACEFLGRFDAVESWILELAARQTARPVFACARALLLARLGRTAEAQRGLHDLVAALPFDQEWLYGMSLIAETAVLVGDLDAAADAYAALAPWHSLNAVDQAEGCRGSVARCLGLIAAALNRVPEASAHFEEALAMNERMGFRPWVARTQDDYARLLRSRGDDAKAAVLEAAARATYEELGAAPA
jgi:hypothetical protein